MKSIKNPFLALSIIALISLSACENELEVFAEYEDVTVVYALLQPEDTLHQIKVNKLFQGEGDALVLAQDPALSQYEADEVNVLIKEVDGNGDTTVFTLEQVEVTNKDSGIFYYPNQMLYEFEAELKEGATYYLEIEKQQGETVRGETSLVQSSTNPVFDEREISRYQKIGMSWVNGSSVNSSQQITVIPPKNSKVFEMVLTFRYQDLLEGNILSEDRYVDISLGTESLPNVVDEYSRSNDFVFEYSPESVFEVIANRVPDLADSPGVIGRKADSIDINLYIGGEELDVYMSVNQPSTSLLEDKPEYTNVVNGLGLVSSRSYLLESVVLTKDSYEELATGLVLGLTGSKGFCNPKALPQESTYCGF